ncbi:MAG: sialate O-acetylesterase [Acidobacteriota bacterium]|nr:sialate O-acetylesterase [Acidobacteriota bacterium]
MKIFKIRLLVAALCATLCLAATASAAVKPSDLFSDHMVLQSGMSVPIWGTADPAEKVTVTLSGQTKSATADASGKWMVRLLKLKAGGPFEMTISGSAGEAPLVVKDVLVGEVWLGSGQSNMQFTVSKAHASYAGMLDEDKEIAAANYPQLRMFITKPSMTYTPQTDVAGVWQVCTPAVVGDWSAVGYLFGRNLNMALKVPVGILLSAYGASTAEAWIPREALVADPLLKPMVDKLDARYSYWKDHPGGNDAGAPPEPMMLNARLPKPGAPPVPLRDPSHNQHQPTVNYNAMINPLVPYAIRGAIWYQGESIGGGPQGLMNYGHVMETLVTTWRKLWGEGNFPFFEVQLPALKNVSNNPLVREQQAKVLSLPNTGMAVTVDVGDPANVHPKNKEPVGYRLELLALAKAYGDKSMEFSGPMYASSKVDGSAMRVMFTHAAGLMAKDPPLKWFQIAGADQNFVDADAKIEGDSVVVSSAAVPNPVAVRYAWDNYPSTANLYNASGLPAAPFRTDNWDAMKAVAAQFTIK